MLLQVSMFLHCQNYWNISALTIFYCYRSVKCQQCFRDDDRRLQKILKVIPLTTTAVLSATLTVIKSWIIPFEITGIILFGNATPSTPNTFPAEWPFIDITLVVATKYYPRAENKLSSTPHITCRDVASHWQAPTRPGSIPLTANQSVLYKIASY